MQEQVSLGHDSEFGLEVEGKPVSALIALNRIDLPEGSVFPDNHNAEMAITPVTTLSEWHRKTEVLLRVARDQGFKLIMEPTIDYAESGADHKDAKVSGCNPDFCAYTGERNKAPDFSLGGGIRSLGAHIHVGAAMDALNFCMWLDLHLGVPLGLVEKASDRRSMYGAAGAHRIKDYPGVEYRTLSNVWIDSKELREFVWEGTHRALEISNSINFYDIHRPFEVPDAINSGDVDKLQKILDRSYIWGVESVG